ncbi:hypothetical protein CCR97_19465 [Rhodoplanes elegans]|uniref:Uncharacterized protein n=1 Tax=Rhodoplanes elegans TaxID=29408 RepID=A0A327K7T8_9BRAD|nr:hypothetical protein [Rhodoplanes elegans]MBK5960359.1 hypothetical protein [Rhodoplanes elegans]RAI33984.1 hypothetical protein CH338_21665 [Rhodoplanes elegans]
MPMLRPSSRVPRSRAIVIVLAAAALVTPLGAADLPGPDDIAVPAPTAPPSPGGDAAGDTAADAALAAERAAVQAFGAKTPACLAWGDGCVTCLRGEDGKVVCANPGPACLPRETACLRVRDVPPDAAPKDAAPADAPKGAAPTAPPAPAAPAKP